MAERAVIYCRISRDSSERGEGVDRQEEDCRALAERLGLDVVAVLVDNDISASTASKKARPKYVDLLARARRREIDVVLAYSNSRLTRRPRELEDLIDLHAATGVLIKTVVSGDDNLATADGRMTARIKANVDAAEAERTAERVARAKQRAAKEGRYRGGPRPYGFNKNGVTIREKEAAVIRRATREILAGRTLAALVKELNEEGHRSSRGSEWTRHSIRDVLLRPRNAGFVGNGRVRVNSTKGDRAIWKPIISEEEFDAVERILLDPGRRTNKGSTESKYLGSGIYTCGKAGCSSVMRSFSVPRRNTKGEKNTKPAYRCQDGDHLTVMADPTDEYVRGVVAGLVRDPRTVMEMNDGENDTLKPVRERRAVLIRSREKTERDYDEDIIDGRRYKAKVEKITAELVEIESRLADAAQQAAVLPIFSALDPGQAFLDCATPGPGKDDKGNLLPNKNIDIAREVLRSVLRVEVQPYEGARGAAWSPDRVRLTLVHA